MKLLLDTHLLLWAMIEPERLPLRARSRIDSHDNQLLFSVASLWEIAIKSSRGRTDFRIDPAVFRRALLDNGYEELPLIGEHVLALRSLPALHKDPFDRLLLAQCMAEGVLLVTRDPLLAQYPGPIEEV
jgi:PIN domain nuclease of toxin-antitoxin system